MPRFEIAFVSKKVGKMTHIPAFSKSGYRRTAVPFVPIVEQ